MNRTLLIAATALSALTLSACAGGGPRRGPPTKVIDRVLVSAPGKAQPSTIVATEVAYARDALEQGQFIAAETYAAPSALVHGRNGPVPFTRIITALKQSGVQTQWKTGTVVMSCDGALAVSQGRFSDKEGKVGNYVTVWERGREGAYQWVYDVAGYDDPQPPPRKQFEDGDIVVTAIDSIKGLVATCPNGAAIPPPPPERIAVSEDASAPPRALSQTSRDGTMRWRWEHRSDGTKYVKAEYFFEGDWQVGVEESLASPRER